MLCALSKIYAAAIFCISTSECGKTSFKIVVCSYALFVWRFVRLSTRGESFCSRKAESIAPQKGFFCTQKSPSYSGEKSRSDLVGILSSVFVNFPLRFFRTSSFTHTNLPSTVQYVYLLMHHTMQYARIGLWESQRTLTHHHLRIPFHRCAAAAACLLCSRSLKFLYGVLDSSN